MLNLCIRKQEGVELGEKTKSRYQAVLYWQAIYLIKKIEMELLHKGNSILMLL